MGRDVSTGTTKGEQAAQARRRSRRQGDPAQVAITEGWTKRDKQVADPLIAAVRKHIDHVIEAKNFDRDKVHLHASEMCKGDWCPRYSWYKLTGVPQEKETSTWWRLNSIFVEGNQIHTKWQTWLWDMGILEGNFLCQDCHVKWWAVAPMVCIDCASRHIEYAEVPIEQPDIMQIGQADGILNIDGEREAIEIKSVGVGTLRFDAPALYEGLQDGSMTLDQVWNSIKVPFPVHIRQGMLYLRYLKERFGITKMRFIYEFKATQEFKSFVVTYNESYLAKILPGAFAVKRAIDSGGTVRRPKWAEDDHPVCKACPYMKTCWGEDA